MNSSLNIASNGQMRAQSISIQVSDRTKCNAGCKFCISRTTPGSEERAVSLKKPSSRRLATGLGYARHIGATHAILTGKADPLQEEACLLYALIETCRIHIPLVDMHTNGLVFGKRGGKALMKGLADAGLTMITFSVASFDEPTNRKIMGIPQPTADIISLALENDLLVRCSLVDNKAGIFDFDGIIEYIRQAGNFGVHQVVIRELWVPEAHGNCDQETRDWNVSNFVQIKKLEDEFLAKVGRYGISEREPLPWGTRVFAVSNIFDDPNHGVNVTFARCDDSNRGAVIKSIVHKPDGHGFRNWDNNGDSLY